MLLLVSRAKILSSLMGDGVKFQFGSNRFKFEKRAAIRCENTLLPNHRQDQNSAVMCVSWLSGNGNQWPAGGN